MKNKGFTLIELLAVIVILAIIALIATPIILGIINDSKKQSEQRSMELYGKAIQNAVAKAQLDGSPMEAGDLSNDFLSGIEYDGSRVVCTTNKLYSDGSIYLAGCTINGTQVDYTYGKEQVSLTRYYWYAIQSGDLTTRIPEGADTNLSNINTDGHPFYLAFDTLDGETIKSAYVCFVRNNKEYCLKANDTDAYTTNQSVIADAYEGVANTGDCSTGCLFSDASYCCSADGLRVTADDVGNVGIDNSTASCLAERGGFFECYEG